MPDNVADFTVIAREWVAEGRTPFGSHLHLDAGLPRSRDMIGRYVEALDKLLRANAEHDAFTDRVHWL